MIETVINTLKDAMSNQGKSLTEISYNMKKLLSINDNIFDYYSEKLYKTSLGDINTDYGKYDPTNPLLIVKNPHNADLALLSIQFDLNQPLKENASIIITNDGVEIYNAPTGALKYADTVFIDFKKGLKFKANKEIKIFIWTADNETQTDLVFVFRIGDYCK